MPRPSPSRSLHGPPTVMKSVLIVKSLGSGGHECPAPALQELALGRVLGAGDRCVVRQRRFGAPAQAPEQVGADGVEQVVTLQVEAVLVGQRRIRSITLGNCARSV